MAASDSNASSQPGCDGQMAADPETWLLTRLRGFHVDGALRSGVEVRCWRCGVTAEFGRDGSAVTVEDVADWCLGHVCPGLTVT